MFNFKQISEGWRISYVNSEVFCGLRDWKFLMNKTWVTCKKNKQQFGKNSYVSKIFMSLKSFCLKNSHVSKFMMSQKFLFSFLFLVILNLFCIFIKKHSNFNYGKKKNKNPFMHTISLANKCINVFIQHFRRFKLNHLLMMITILKTIVF